MIGQQQKLLCHFKPSYSQLTVHYVIQINIVKILRIFIHILQPKRSLSTYINIKLARPDIASGVISNGLDMPIYHFNLQDGQSYPDVAGSEYPDLDAARTEAVRRSGVLLRDNATSFWGGNGWKLIVTDQNGMILFTLHFLAVASPATERYGATRPELPPDLSSMTPMI